jgi:hypothetical protein
VRLTRKETDSLARQPKAGRVSAAEGAVEERVVQLKKICVAAGLVARENEGGYRDEWRLDHDRADRQEPNLVSRLTVHEIPTLEAMDRSHPLEKRQAGTSRPAPG